LLVQFASLLAAGAGWFLLHAAIAGSPLRFWLIARLGEKAYRGAFSVASLASLWWLIQEYGRAPYSPLWLTPRALSFVPLVLVPVAFVFLVGAFTVPSPTAVGGERVLAKGSEPRGMLRITRHPFLWSVIMWSVAHLVANCDVGSLIFFASLGVTAMRGTFDIDHKRRITSAEEFAKLEKLTSNVPFAALLAGRNRVVAREMWLPVLLGLALALGAIALHSRVFGAPAVPALHGF
jgi:uncharacterized membrane protein